MKRALVTASILAIGMVWLAGPAWSQQVATPEAKQPWSVEAGPEAAPPLKIRVEDPDELFRQFQQIHLRQKGATAKGPEKNAEAEDGTGVRRVLAIDPQPVVNFFPSFFFGDVTPRDGGTERLPQLTMQQRRAAVESYRRALAQKKNGN